MRRSGKDQTAERRWHEVWREQCEAAGPIGLQYGTVSAFDHMVGEKLLTSAPALPQFVSEFRRMFTPEEIEEQLAQIKSAPLQRAMNAMDVYDPELDDLAAATESEIASDAWPLQERPWTGTMPCG